MKKTLQTLLSVLALSQATNTVNAQTVVTGPSATQSPYVLPILPGYTITSILNSGTSVNNYIMPGLPDGLGAFDNNDGTFTLLMNHEFGSGSTGATHAYGSAGAFVSKWIINKSTLSVVSGADLTQNVYLWNPSTSTYSLYNAANSTTLAGFGRFCSADLPAVTAFYNSYTGKGTQERIFMNGEETGNEGRMMAHIATGPNAGSSYELPFLGKFSSENLVANPRKSDKTIVAGFDDSTPGQVYIYVGNKSANGNEITKAGLSGGVLYGVAVSGALFETNALNIPANTTFSLVNLGAGIQSITGSSLQTLSNNLGVTQFLRPEDGCWDPSNPRDLYFNTTNAFNSPTRVWKLRFNDLNYPELGGTITAVLDGTEGGQMFDNMTIDNTGHLLLNEDVGNNAWLGRILDYEIATDILTPIAQHDANRFTTSGSSFLTQDEEASGIVDVASIFGPGKFLFVSQAHYSIPSPVVEGGQLLMLSSAVSASSNPEINLQGNAVTIPAGNTGISAGNNTDFGTHNVGVNQTRVFNIQNTGSGPLWVSSIDVSGINAGDFIVLNPPSFPVTIPANGSQTIAVKFSPALVGTRSATININNNDFNESSYDFAVQGNGAAPEINIQGNSTNIPDGNTATSSSDNTSFGSVFINNAQTRTYLIQNTGNGTLTISGMNVNGANAAEFTFINLSSFPLTLAGGASQSFTLQFLPVASGNRTAKVNVSSDDTDENAYDFVVSGVSMVDVGIKKSQDNSSSFSIYPNPVKDEVTVEMTFEKNQSVTIFVTDVVGKVVIETTSKDFHQGTNKVAISTTDLKNGVYFIEVNTGSRSDKIKMIVQH